MDINTMKNKSIVYVVGFIPLLMATQVQATIYKCVNAEAEVYYNDKPCPVTTIERTLKGVKDPKGGYIPPKFVADEEKSASSGVVVGEQSGRKLDRSKNDKSDSSENTSNSGNSSGSGTRTSSSDSSSKSSESTNTASSSGTSNNGSSLGNKSDSKRTTKRVMHKERDYGKEKLEVL